jgi:transient receptor potential cation channel subfamily M protein 3
MGKVTEEQQRDDEHHFHEHHLRHNHQHHQQQQQQQQNSDSDVGDSKNKQQPQHPRRNKRKRRGSNSAAKKIRKSLGSANAPPRHVHGGDWKEMLSMTQKVAFQLARPQSDGHLTEIPRRQSLKPSNSMDTVRSKSNISGSKESLARRRAPSSSSTAQADWIIENFEKRECSFFISSSKDPDKCGCGKWRNQHSAQAFQGPEERYRGSRDQKWVISRHTLSAPTDAFGTIEFQGGPHPHKAQYIRLSFDSNPADIMTLFEKVWQIPPPKLIITVHGGISNFDIQPKLARVFRKGLLKAARTTGAWIITSGINAGVVRHVAAAVEGAIESGKNKSKPKIISIGIAPWGLLKKKDDFIGEDKVVAYHPHSFSPKGRFAVLNNRHSYFLLVDNGTNGRYGADIILRRALEGYIVKKQKIDGGERSVPVVCVCLEGGTCTIRTVLDYVTNYPRVPVVICDGSGRASDLLAFAHQHVNQEGTLPEGIRPQMLSLIKNVFGYNHENAQCLLLDIIACVREKKLITVFRLGEDQKHDVDYAILTALLKGHNLKPSEQLALALAWNRVDIARSDVFVMGQDWSTSDLHDAMLEALIHNRVDFVRLLLENGVSMHKFLTIERLEQLYNTEHPSTLYFIVRDVVRINSNYRYVLPHIGLAIEKLMGYGYRSFYTGSQFRKQYTESKQKLLTKLRRNSYNTRSQHNMNNDYLAGPLSVIASSFGINPSSDTAQDTSQLAAAPSGSRALSNHLLWRSAFRHDNFLGPTNNISTPPPTITNNGKETIIEIEDDASSEQYDGEQFGFQYPFNDLLIWAVLTKRHEMALCMWEHGEEAMAKALVACRLYKSLSKEAAEDYLEVEICEELKKYADEFRQLSLELLDTCYKHDDANTLQLLTYELSYWGHETCLSLAVIVNNKAFLAHPCCQILLADLWHGGLRIRSNSNFKVVLGLLCPPTIFFLEFKSREELMKQPQTAAEHEDDINDSDSSSDSDVSSSSSGDSDFEYDPTHAGPQNRRVSTDSVHSTNFPYIFPSRRKRRENNVDKNAGGGGGGVEMRNRDATPNLHHLTPNGRPHAASIATPGYAEPTSRKRIRTLSQRGKSSFSENHGDSLESSTVPPQTKVEERKKPDYQKRKSIFTTMAQKTFKRGNSDDVPKDSFFVRFYGKRQIKIRRKFYEFFVAPITTFWSWCISYIIFLGVMTYVLLIRTPPTPTYYEYFLYFYVSSFGVEMVRKFFMSEPKRLKEKFGHFFFCNYWNIFTACAVVSFFIGVVIRLFDSQSYGRCIMAISSVLWSIKLLDFFSVHPKFGPLVTMAGKMILSMTHVVIMLCVSMLSFGLARQSITFPNEEWHWILIRNIFYKPYFMLYGEVYADEIDTCGDTLWDGHLEDGVSIPDYLKNSTHSCVPGYWIPPLLMVVFLLISNILLISMLIAIFNNIFVETNQIAQQIWLFQRYHQVMEYESTPFVPPPFTLIYHFYMLLKVIKHKLMICCKLKKNTKKKLFDFSLKLFLSPDQVEKLHDFEEECVEDYARDKEYQKNRSNEERLQRTAERTDLLLVRMNDLIVKESHLKSNVHMLESRIEMIEERQNEMLDCLRQITSALPTIVSALQPRVTTPLGDIIPQPSFPKISTIEEPQQSENIGIEITGSQNNVVIDVNSSSNEQTPFSDEQSAGTRRLRTSTISGHELSQPQSQPNSSKLFGSILSLNSAQQKPGSVRRRNVRPHDEYTSITDTIEIGGIGPSIRIKEYRHHNNGDSDTNDLPLRTEAEDDDEEDFDFNAVDASDLDTSRDTPTTTLKRAKQSFVKRQNTILQKYEEDVGGHRYEAETGDDITSGGSSPELVKSRSSTLKTVIQNADSDEYLQFTIDGDATPKPSITVTSFSEPSTPESTPSRKPLLQKQFQVDPVHEDSKP